MAPLETLNVGTAMKPGLQVPAGYTSDYKGLMEASVFEKHFPRIDIKFLSLLWLQNVL